MTDSPTRVLVTGGAGFIGTNLVARLIEEGREVVVFDSLVRPGSETNARWLTERYAQRCELIAADVRDRVALQQALRGVDHVVHLAAQVAVTTSLSDPLEDFDVNTRGTLTLLESIRTCAQPPSLVFTSTNKVYGALEDIELDADAMRYVARETDIRERGIGESRSLDFHSPYGCSKGAADQYVLDYARSFGLRNVVLRMSCIYGPHQNGNEDQGWVAHFVRHADGDRRITIFGDGRQVRDVLYVDDLLNAFALVSRNIERLSGQAFNIGGGPRHTLSLRELVRHLERGEGPLQVAFDAWRVGDQRYYVSDTTRFERATGWRADVAPDQGLASLRAWLRRARPRRPAARGARVSIDAAQVRP